MNKDCYTVGKKQLKIKIEKFFKEQKERNGCNDIFDETTNQGYANSLLLKALNLFMLKI